MIRGDTSSLSQRAVHDPQALVCALSLDAGVLSRNRNFALYTEPAMRHAHGRACALRSLARDLLAIDVQELHALELRSQPGAAVQLVYRDDSISLIRSVALEPLEVSLLKLMITSRQADDTPHRLRASDSDRAVVRSHLGRIGLELQDSALQASGE